jgi:hypothetical protein
MSISLAMCFAVALLSGPPSPVAGAQVRPELKDALFVHRLGSASVISGSFRVTPDGAVLSLVARTTGSRPYWEEALRREGFRAGGAGEYRKVTGAASLAVAFARPSLRPGGHELTIELGLEGRGGHAATVDLTGAVRGLRVFTLLPHFGPLVSLEPDDAEAAKASLAALDGFEAVPTTVGTSLWKRPGNWVLSVTLMPQAEGDDGYAIGPNSVSVLVSFSPPASAEGGPDALGARSWRTACGTRARVAVYASLAMSRFWGKPFPLRL